LSTVMNISISLSESLSVSDSLTFIFSFLLEFEVPQTDGFLVVSLLVLLVFCQCVRYCFLKRNILVYNINVLRHRQ
jgi:hypothetical protein